MHLANPPAPLAIDATLALSVPNWAVNLMIVGFVFISVLMVLVVLIQKPQGGGLSGAFGASSDGAGQTALGVRTGDALTMLTIGVFVLFLGFAIVLNYATRPEARAAAAQVQAAQPEPANTNAGDSDTTTDDNDTEAAPDDGAVEDLSAEPNTTTEPDADDTEDNAG